MKSIAMPVIVAGAIAATRVPPRPPPAPPSPLVGR
jgi:hypothetical protein